MKKITTDSCFSGIEELKEYQDYVMYRCAFDGHDPLQESFKTINHFMPTWNADSLVAGVKRLYELSQEQQVMYDVYPEAQCDDVQKKDVKLFHFPSFPETRKADAPFVMMTAGGAYSSVCSMVEAFPTAVQFNHLGYDVFCLNYRVGGFGVIPKPLEDFAAAYKMIISRQEHFRLNSSDYIACGFSAGANLVCLWGTEGSGWKHYQLPRPHAIIPVYPVISLKYTYEDPTHMFEKIMLGEKYRDSADSYDVEALMTSSYPPAYIVHCEDDSTVPVFNSCRLKELLTTRNIPAMPETGAKGEHGFGDGRGTDVEGWIGRAVSFVEHLQETN